jgi:hypothetical protein
MKSRSKTIDLFPTTTTNRGSEPSSMIHLSAPQQVTTGNRTSGDDAALVIERGNAGKVGDLSKDCVESVGLLTSLGRELSSSGPGLSTSGTSGSVCSTLVHELVADELADDVEVLCGTVVVAHCVPKSTTLAESAWQE